MAMTREQYENRRSWLIDTAETPEDKKKLASDLAKLDAAYKAQVLAEKKKELTPAQRAKIVNDSRRSNQPRIGTRLEEDQQDDYHMAVEVAGQSADTPAQKSAKKRAEATARDFERRFPTLSERPSGTQAGHHVTSGDNHTKPVSAADKQAEAKRPAVGNDKSAAKKANGPSWNNGYTN